MDLSNSTRNQHYLSQVEQRLNASNPDATNRNQRIYEFKLVDRETHTIELTGPKGRSITSALALDDLFSFDVAPELGLRFNLERLFQQAEDAVRSQTESLLVKLDAGDSLLGDELVGLLTAKLLNFARNPFSVRKMLNTFGHFTNFVPTDPSVLALLAQVLRGRRPHQKYLCEQLQISEDDYARWLGILFMLLHEMTPGHPPMLEGMVRALFEPTTHQVGVLVCSYTQERCLLSDRSLNTISDNDSALTLEFNLRSDTFIRYVFIDIGRFVPNNLPRALVESFKGQKRSVDLRVERNNMDLLRAFNQNAVYQCFAHVYCAVRNPLVR